MKQGIITPSLWTGGWETGAAPPGGWKRPPLPVAAARRQGFPSPWAVCPPLERRRVGAVQNFSPPENEKTGIFRCPFSCRV